MAADIELMRLHAETLFLHDEQGRLVVVNDVERKRAPRFYLGRTGEGNIWRFRNDLPAGLIAEFESILADEPVTSDLEQRAVTKQRLLAALTRDEPVEAVWAGPAWCFPERLEIPGDIQAVRVEPGMRFSGDRFKWLADELEMSQPVFVVLDGDRIVSLCHSSRNTLLAAEAGVETLDGYRGRGYATAVVSAWAREVRAQGREPLYSTSWDNHASRVLARRLGLLLYGADLHFG